MPNSRAHSGLQLFLGDNATADCIAAESTGCGVCPTSCAPFTAAPDSAGSVGVTTVAATSGAPDSSSTANTASKGSVNVVVIGLAAVGGLLLCAFIVTCYCLARPAPDPFSNIGKWEPGNQILTISFENPACRALPPPPRTPSPRRPRPSPLSQTPPSPSYFVDPCCLLANVGFCSVRNIVNADVRVSLKLHRAVSPTNPSWVK